MTIASLLPIAARTSRSMPGGVSMMIVAPSPSSTARDSSRSEGASTTCTPLSGASSSHSAAVACGSASMRSTGPASWSRAARYTAVVVFPTPPFTFTTPMRTAPLSHLYWQSGLSRLSRTDGTCRAQSMLPDTPGAAAGFVVEFVTCLTVSLLHFHMSTCETYMTTPVTGSSYTLLDISSVMCHNLSGTLSMNTVEYFGLNEQPFRIGPDPRYLFYSGQVKEAIAKCEYMARDRVGPIYMYGPIGSGKTSILRRLTERLGTDPRYTVAYVISPNVRRANTFLKIIMDAFDVPALRSYDANLKLFETFLIEQYKAKNIPVLFLDEAQNANRDALRLVHYLLNFETATLKLLQIVLAGQQELAAKILRYQELASRMFPIAINAMSERDLEEMVRFRWLVAGGKELPFVKGNGAYKNLYAYTKGLPRDAVKVCDEVLRELQASGRRQATIAEVEALAQQFNLTI